MTGKEITAVANVVISRIFLMAWAAASVWYFMTHGVSLADVIGFAITVGGITAIIFAGCFVYATIELWLTR